MQSFNPQRVGDLHPSLGATLSGTNLERAGDHNQRVTLQAIRVSGPITRADLAEITGLTAPAIANITKRLLSEGLIQNAGRLHGQRGQPAMKLAINPDGCFSVGLNIDRDHITLVVLDLLGQVRARASLEVDFALPAQAAAFFSAEMGIILARGDIAADRIVGIGVAMPDDLGRINLPHTPDGYGAWNTVDLDATFGAGLSLPVFIENDATAAALGELQFGLGIQHPSFFYILMSLGLGGGLVIDGHYVRGADGRSGEIGFIPVAGTPSRMLQDTVSLSALYGFMAREGFVVERPDQLADLPPDGRDCLQRWIAEAATSLEAPILAISCLVNPEAIFLGGRLPAAVVDALAEAVNARTGPYIGTVPAIARVKRATMAADAPAVGAAILPFSHRLLPSRQVLMKTA